MHSLVHHKVSRADRVVIIDNQLVIIQAATGFSVHLFVKTGQTLAKATA